jgi:hypothetical protein
MPPSQDAVAAAAAADSGTDAEDAVVYRPGFDLEEDFERIMNEEEEGRQGCWDFSSEAEDDASDCSSLIAAGRDGYIEEEERPAVKRNKPVLPPLRSAVQNTSNGQASAGASSECWEPLCGVQHSVGAVAAAAVAEGAPVRAEAGAAGPAAAGGDASEDESDSLCEEQRLEDAVGLHEEEYGQEQEEQQEHGSGSVHSINRCAKYCMRCCSSRMRDGMEQAAQLKRGSHCPFWSVRRFTKRSLYQSVGYLQVDVSQILICVQVAIRRALLVCTSVLCCLSHLPAQEPWKTGAGAAPQPANQPASLAVPRLTYQQHNIFCAVCCCSQPHGSSHTPCDLAAANTCSLKQNCSRCL